MNVISLSSMSSSDWLDATAALERGRLLVVPTDTVYGIACKPEPGALKRLYAVKGREPGKPVALVFDDIIRLVHSFTRLPAPVLNAVERLLPGAVTVILPAPAKGPGTVVESEGGVGVRVVPLPEGSIFQRLPAPLALTSANIAGGPDPCAVSEIPAVMRDACDYIIDAGRTKLGVASTVVDLRPLAEKAPARVLREGSLSCKRIEELIGSPVTAPRRPAV